MPAKRYTVAEANALIPTLAPMLDELAESLHAYRFATEQLKELHDLHGVSVPHDHRDHADFARFTDEARRADKRASALLTRFADLGVEVKDPFVGLLDFQAERKGDVVYLCWRAGEAGIEAWHPIEGGFAARKPIAEF